MSYLTRSGENVKGFFSKIAPSYDRLNSLMSLGLHYYWNQKLIKMLESAPNDHYLDVCAGTGAISKIYLKKTHPKRKVILLDFCQEMLDIAKKDLTSQQKAYCPSATLEFVCSDACHMPLESETIDRLSMAYGLRNIVEPKKALQECYRVMKPGARICILELTRPSSYWLRKLHGLWLKLMIAGLTAFYSREGKAYRYLAESIKEFIDPPNVLSYLKQAGFKQGLHLPLNGQIASIFIAEKPQINDLEL